MWRTNLLAVALMWLRMSGATNRNIDSIDYGGVTSNTYLDSSPEFIRRVASQTHYVASYRPSEGSGVADNTILKILPRRLINIDDVAQTFTLEFRLDITWRDTRLAMTLQNKPAGASSKFKVRVLPGRDGEPDGTYAIPMTPGNADPVRLWSPRVETGLNVMEPLEILSESFAIYNGGIVYKSQQIKGTFSQRLDLSSYPFDTHRLVVTLLSPAYSRSEVALKLLNYETAWDVDPWSEGWDIGSLTHYIGQKLIPNAKGTNEDFDVYTMEIQVQRKPGFVLVSQALPLMVIMIMACATFIMEINGYEKRMTILFTAILTLMAFSVYLGESLPKLAYLTAMHKLIVATYVMLVMGVIFVSIQRCCVQDACAAADQDSNGETTHREMESFCRYQQKMYDYENRLKVAGLDARPREEEKVANKLGLAAKKEKLKHSESSAMPPSEDGGMVSINIQGRLRKPNEPGDIRRGQIAPSPNQAHDELSPGSRPRLQPLTPDQIQRAVEVAALAKQPKEPHGTESEMATFSAAPQTPRPESKLLLRKGGKGEPERQDKMSDSTAFLDVDGDGVISEQEHKLWQALDVDKDGILSLNEMLEHTSSMPLSDWNAFHVYVFLLTNGVHGAAASKALQQGITGDTIEHFSEKAYEELGINSAIQAAHIKSEVIKASKRSMSIDVPVEDSTTNKGDDVSQASQYKGCFTCGQTSNHKLIMAIVHVDYHLRYAYILIWLLIAVLLFSLAENGHYAGDYLGVTKYDTSVACDTLFLTTACYGS